MNDQDWATQPSPFKGQYLPDYQPLVRWVMPKTSEGLLETYYYNKAGQMKWLEKYSTDPVRK
ncbi:MAG: hypothetical protein V7K26_03425 [Nostoc sp.]|uniref:hypothetical protein n=1 Tax=Nostoc sp. TaxID=1180 RepID=UPI002FEE8313